MATLFSSAAARTVYIQLAEQITSGPIAGCMSATIVDELIYDGDTYRNELSGGYVGGSNVNGAAYIASFITADDVYNHTPPHFWQKTITHVFFWSGANGTGDVLFTCPITNYRGYSIAEFTLIS